MLQENAQTSVKHVTMESLVREIPVTQEEDVFTLQFTDVVTTTRNVPITFATQLRDVLTLSPERDVHVKERRLMMETHVPLIDVTQEQERSLTD